MTHLFALIQIPLALALVWHCCQVRRRIDGWIRDVLTLVVACGGGMIAWRIASFTVVPSLEDRAAGGMGMQTLFLVAVFLLVHAVGQLNDQRR